MRVVPSRRRRRTALGGLAALALAVGLPALPAVAALPVPVTTHGGALAPVASRPAIPAGSVSLGPLAPSRTIAGAVALAPRNAGQLASYAEAVSTPGSAEYHRYLTPRQFDQAFRPAAATIAAVEASLRAGGLSVGGVSGNGLLVNFRGPASAVDAAFHTTLASFRLRSGKAVYADTTAPRLPVTLAADVQSVVGLNDLVTYHAGVVRGQTGRPAGAAPTGSAARPVVAAPTGSAARPVVAAPTGSAGRPIVAPDIPVGGAPGGFAIGHARAKAPARSTKAATGGPAACSDASSTAVDSGGLTDTQIANAYGVGGLYKAGDTGAGQTVAVFELEPFMRSDIQAFDTCYFGATKAKTMLSRLHTIDVDGGQQIGPGSGEAALDIEDVSAIAPGATIDVYEAPNTEYGAMDEYNAIVSADTAKVLTTSWGLCEAQAESLEPGIQQLENTVFEEAAAQGQSVFAAAGDDGSDDCAEHGTAPVNPILSVDDPGSQPFVTSVGGTTILDATEPPAEQVWNDGNLWGAGGGGISSTWKLPEYQAAAKVPGIDNAAVIKTAEAVSGSDFCAASPAYKDAPCREVPDVSAQADEFTGAITIEYEGSWFTVGGTSSATPLWAAMVADINANPACAATGGVGFVNPDLYQVASVPAERAASFNDITMGNNDIFGAADGSYPATAGYDMASGLGSPRVTNANGKPGLAFYLCASRATQPTVTSLSPDAVADTGGAKFTISGYGFAKNGVSDVAGVQIGDYRVPTADWTVDATALPVPTITVTVPAAFVERGNGGSGDGTGDYDVLVTVTGGATSQPNPTSRLIMFPTASSKRALPDVAGVGPSGGNERGGTKVTVYGSGFAGATGVTFGGVKAKSFTVVSDSEITAVTPAYNSAHTACLAGNKPTTDVCQSQVRVRNANGESPEATIKPEAEGNLGTATGEEAPAATEFDYLPTPTLTGFSLDPPPLANEQGGTTITVTGKGLGILGFEWADVGSPGQEVSQDFSPVAVSGTSETFMLPAIAATNTVMKEPVSIQTLASPNTSLSSSTFPSNPEQVPYAPFPQVTNVVAKGGKTLPIAAVGGIPSAVGPSTGGTTLTITGVGFDGVSQVQLVDEVSFIDASQATVFASQLVSADNTKIVLKTPAANPGIDGVVICNPSAPAPLCSPLGGIGDLFTYYPPGNPSVSSDTPKTGPSGTVVTIIGHNLGFVQNVLFGTKVATEFENFPTFTDAGSATEVIAIAPNGTVGKKVDIRLETLESEATLPKPNTAVNPAVTFTYTK